MAASGSSLLMGRPWLTSISGRCSWAQHLPCEAMRLDQHKMLAEKIGSGDIFGSFPKCKAPDLLKDLATAGLLRGLSSPAHFAEVFRVGGLQARCDAWPKRPCVDD